MSDLTLKPGLTFERMDSLSAARKEIAKLKAAKAPSKDPRDTLIVREGDSYFKVQSAPNQNLNLTGVGTKPGGASYFDWLGHQITRRIPMLTPVDILHADNKITTPIEKNVQRAIDLDKRFQWSAATQVWKELFKGAGSATQEDSNYIMERLAHSGYMHAVVESLRQEQEQRPKSGNR